VFAGWKVVVGVCVLVVGLSLGGCELIQSNADETDLLLTRSAYHGVETRR
jgi:hypothetical protein